jgi:hypothetical protein
VVTLRHASDVAVGRAADSDYAAEPRLGHGDRELFKPAAASRIANPRSATRSQRIRNIADNIEYREIRL